MSEQGSEMVSIYRRSNIHIMQLKFSMSTMTRIVISKAIEVDCTWSLPPSSKLFLIGVHCWHYCIDRICKGEIND